MSEKVSIPVNYTKSVDWVIKAYENAGVTFANGFQKDYKLPKDMAPSRLYKQAGNSVCVSVIRRIAEILANELELAKN